MKKVVIILLAAVGAFIIQSCGSSYKDCGAYSKHESGERPAYSEVQ